MDITNKKKLVLMIVLVLIAIISITLQRPTSPSPMSFIPILPSRVLEKSTVENSSYRQDYFSIVNLDRSDSVKLLSGIFQHACKVVDSVNLKKYVYYRIEYYENGPYMNDSTMSTSLYNHNSIYRSDDELWHVADEVDAFVCWIVYYDGNLSLIKWYKNGKIDDQVQIPITDSLKEKLICK